MRKKNILAIIPSRKGSKRLKNKNSLELGGKPLFMWSLDAAIKSRLFTDIFLSTDSKKIFNLAKKKDCFCPNLRSKKLSTGNITLIEVCIDIIKYYRKEIGNIDCVVLLQPTSPFRSISSMKRGIEKFFLKSNKQKRSVVSVGEVHKHPKWCFTEKNKLLKPYLKKSGINLQSQNLETVYAPTGSLYITDPDRLIKEKSFFSKKTLFLNCDDKYENLDIDEIFDLKIAKSIIKYGISKFKN